MTRHLRWLIPLSMLAVPAPMRAEVVEANASGFALKQTASISAPREKVYKALLRIGSWWDSEHTYSGDAANLRLDARAGGCWCETLPHGGGVQHMTVVYVDPNKRIVLSGGLGPLQTSGLAGAMTWQLTPQGGATEFVLIYNVGGYAAGGFGDLAGGVDGVLRAQIDRLKRWIETGNAAQSASPDTRQPQH